MAKKTKEKKVKTVKPKEETVPIETIVEEKLVEEKPLPKKIRVLFSLANSTHSYTPGGSYEVGKDIPKETAASWLKNGVAIEDMSSEGPEETK